MDAAARTKFGFTTPPLEEEHGGCVGRGRSPLSKSCSNPGPWFVGPIRDIGDDDLE